MQRLRDREADNMSKSQRVTVKDASIELGMSEMSVRVRMERSLFDPPIGRVQPSLQGKRTIYLIYRDMLDEYIGKK